MMTAAASLESVVKRFHHVRAVDGISLQVQPGEFVGFIGPNGAGKTTTMRCLTGQLVPDEGIVAVGGVSVTQDPIGARGKLGYVPQELELYEYLTGEELLRFVGDIRGIPAAEQTARVEELLALTELTGARNQIIREYSGGMERKIAIASALIARPPLLLLDESFVGLDPESTHALRGHLREYCEDGGAIILSSHILDMLERICSRVLVLASGRLVGDLSRVELDEDPRTLLEIYLELTARTAPSHAPSTSGTT
jgi:ABC-2 type transport system ATP-binding protein